MGTKNGQGLSYCSSVINNVTKQCDSESESLCIIDSNDLIFTGTCSPKYKEKHLQFCKKIVKIELVPKMGEVCRIVVLSFLML